MRAALALVLALAACKHDAIEVRQVGAADYNRKALLAAIDRYTAAGQTAVAYGQLAADIAALRTGMDETVAAEAELQLVVLALPPVDAAQNLPLATRASTLATTVWSTALAGSVEAPDPQLGPRRPGDPAKPGESVADYVTRLCGGPLAVSCMLIVPEVQAELVEAEAVRRFARRTKHAVSACSPCSSEPAWQRAVDRWESLERETSANAAAAIAPASPARWPIAGPASAPWSPAPRLDITDDGGWILDGEPVAPDAKGTALSGSRTTAGVLAVHIAPTARADVLAALIDAAGVAGFREVAVEARMPMYPWERRVYRFATGARGKKPPWRAVDTVQVLMRAFDHSVAPGALAHL
ncbi:MAG: hypothetical protein K8W52_33935 [Deltaproteobacteria bacterium]|nr:hypothetical protein [Deltaproteobacteria bacterium]